jgi:hypothetical protein
VVAVPRGETAHREDRGEAVAGEGVRAMIASARGVAAAAEAGLVVTGDESRKRVVETCKMSWAEDGMLV